MHPWLERVYDKIESLAYTIVKRTTTNVIYPTAESAQTRGIAGSMQLEMEHFQPQGLHFQPPPQSEGIEVCPGGIADNAVLLCASKRTSLPTDVLLPGEGGLHFLGTYKVFLGVDGSVNLGQKVATDFVARASLVDAQITALKADITALKVAIASGLTAVGVGPAANGPAGASAFTSASSTIPTASAPTGSLTVRTA